MITFVFRGLFSTSIVFSVKKCRPGRSRESVGGVVVARWRLPQLGAPSKVDLGLRQVGIQQQSRDFV